MYIKPEVTRYSGKELLDLMGPVETQYDCDLNGDQVSCNLEFILQSPGGRELGDVFDGPEDVEIGYQLTNPCGFVFEGECTLGGGCIFDDPGEIGPESTQVPLVFSDLCSIPCRDGEWTLEAWWINDGEEYPSCTTTVDFQE